MLITATKLWYDGELAVGLCTTAVNCDQLIGSTPRNAYLVPAGGNCGAPFYNLSLSRPNPYPDGTLQGVWLEFRGGTGMMIDALSAEDVINACDGCCGNSPVIAGRYNGMIPEPGAPAAAVYQFTRPDSGDSYAYQRASGLYWPQWIPNTFSRVSYAAGISTYQFSSYEDPIWYEGDTPTTESDRVFKSNVAPTLPADNQYRLIVTINGVMVEPVLAAASLAALVTAANGNTAYSDLGTWAVSGSQITLTTDTVNGVQIIIQPSPSQVFESNEAPTLAGSNVYNMTVTTGAGTLSPVLTGGALSNLVTAANGDDGYAALGVWSTADNKMVLTSYSQDAASIVVGQQAP